MPCSVQYVAVLSQERDTEPKKTVEGHSSYIYETDRFDNTKKDTVMTQLRVNRLGARVTVDKHEAQDILVDKALQGNHSLEIQTLSALVEICWSLPTT